MKNIVLYIFISQILLFAEKPKVIWETNFFSDSIRTPTNLTIYSNEDGYYFEYAGPNHYELLETNILTLTLGLNFIDKTGNSGNKISLINYGGFLKGSLNYQADKYLARKTTAYGVKYFIFDIDEEHNVNYYYKDTLNEYFETGMKWIYNQDTVYLINFNNDNSNNTIDYYDYHLQFLKSIIFEIDSIPYPINTKNLEYTSMNSDKELLFVFAHDLDPGKCIISKFTKNGKHIKSVLSDRFYENTRFTLNYLINDKGEIFTVNIERQPTAIPTYSWHRFIRIVKFDKNINKLWEKEIEFNEDHYIRGFNFNQFNDKIIIYGNQYLEKYRPNSPTPRNKCFYIGEINKNGEYEQSFYWNIKEQEETYYSSIYNLKLNELGNYIVYGKSITSNHLYMAEIKPVPTSVHNSDFMDGTISISPNPAEDYIEISLDGAHLEGGHLLNIEIYDVLGNVVINYELKITNYDIPHKINVSPLSKGVYFVKIGNITEKFVKM